MVWWKRLDKESQMQMDRKYKKTPKSNENVTICNGLMLVCATPQQVHWSLQCYIYFELEYQIWSSHSVYTRSSIDITIFLKTCNKGVGLAVSEGLKVMKMRLRIPNVAFKFNPIFLQNYSNKKSKLNLPIIILIHVSYVYL